MKTVFTWLVALFSLLWAEAKYTTQIKPAPDEKWWGGMVAMGSRMPFEEKLNYVDLGTTNWNNQNVPLLLSSHGRYVWSDYPFSIKIHQGVIELVSEKEELQALDAGDTLRDAYMVASAKHFPSSQKLPHALFFSMPQYNTWIELMYNQNQKDILHYAESVKAHQFPVGVLMVDDNWQKYYGNFEFKPDRFPDPKGMVEQLHADGFKIMLWVCPFVSPDSPEFRYLEKKGYLISTQSGGAAMIRWWNGVSACYDTTNPEAVAHLVAQLKKLQKEYGIDGYKFDAGDINFYTNKDLVFHQKGASAVDLCESWAKIGLQFPFNEYRASWKMGGQALVQRLGDKSYSWNSLRLLIPDMIAAGLLGHAYTCPDMIGGGEFSSFLNVDAAKFDQELIVRSCQLHALMPMMQFSVAPWRILDKKHLDITMRFARLHEQMGDYILSCAQHAAQTGEPILRSMEYSYPHQGFAQCKDQFMLGDKYLVAPMVSKGYSRKVMLPKGRWQDDLGEIIEVKEGVKTLDIAVPIERLPYYQNVGIK